MRLATCLTLLLYLTPGWGQVSSSSADRCDGQALALPGLTITETQWVDAAGGDYSYCRLSGELERRVSPVDGQTYAIRFEMRLPSHWNLRFLFQGNGGTDGRVVPATGSSANRQSSALDDGFAVISTDTGHEGGAGFGFDPQARINYGYRANEVLTPIAKALIEQFYGAGPAYSYFAGCSNGGRHAMVAASRLADQFDGFLAGNPGFNLPRAAVQHAWDVQALSSIDSDLASALSADDMQAVAAWVIRSCDSLDGLADGMVQDIAGCQAVFEPSGLQCAAGQQSGCLSSDKLAAVEKLFSGPVDSQGNNLYSDWAWDAGVAATDWRRWKVEGPIGGLPLIATLGAGSLASVFTTPPATLEPGMASGVAFLRAFDFDRDAPKIYATTGLYSESAFGFMTPPDAARMGNLANSDSKLIVYHGASDGVFSVNDSIAWFETLDTSHDGNAERFTRLFVVPGMNHCAGGPATDRFDLLGSLIDWVENDIAPDRVTATVNPTNPELGDDWSRQRSRPLCPYPQVATYTGGDPESAASFACRITE